MPAVVAMQLEARKEMAAILDAENHEGQNDKLAKLRGAINKRIAAVLTDQQKE